MLDYLRSHLIVAAIILILILAFVPGIIKRTIAFIKKLF